MKDLKPRKEQLKGVQARSPELIFSEDQCGSCSLGPCEANMEVQMAVFEVFETGVPIYTALKLFRKPWMPWDLESLTPGPIIFTC